jgi:hypothetical protein
MDTVVSAPAALTERIAARLECLGPPRLAARGASLALGPRHGAAEPVEMLLRIVAAGPQGLAFASLCAALWPRSSSRTCLARFRANARALALLAGIDSAPLLLEGDLAAVDRALLEVDSLALEEALAPLLVPFADPAFLHGFEQPWALAARLRIADKLARAARRLAIQENPS